VEVKRLQHHLSAHTQGEKKGDLETKNTSEVMTGEGEEGGETLLATPSPRGRDAVARRKNP